MDQKNKDVAGALKSEAFWQRQTTALRLLSIDMVEAAKSGHPGMPMGMAEIAAILWLRHLRHHPGQPNWCNRDRFVLSNGHGCALLYALLHLSGYDLTKQDLQNFRQLHSKTPGHPEIGVTPGVDVSTGPLGQGLAMAVGLAMAEHQLAATFNRPDHEIVDHWTYVFVGDGCLMEGVSHEAAGLAGRLGLGKLIVFYDDNRISIDGNTVLACGEDKAARFRAYGWQVIPEVDGHDSVAIDAAIMAAKQVSDRPTLIVCRTEIGRGSVKHAGSESCHGAPLGLEERDAVAKALVWHHRPFEVPEDIYTDWLAVESGDRAYQDWQCSFEAYRKAYPDLAAAFDARMGGKLAPTWLQQAESFAEQIAIDVKPEATRVSSQRCLQKLQGWLPELIGGSADLAGSNGVMTQETRAWHAHEVANHIHYGVREFAMFAATNGLTLHGGFRAFAATFLTFMDYGRSALRMAALMHTPAIFVLTHDSLALGEDGPTHQPIEHLAMLRATPNVDVWRPADAFETASAWRAALERIDGPTCLILSRQKMKNHPRPNRQVDAVLCGGYIYHEPEADVQGIFVATGSEVDLAYACAQALAERGQHWRVVSMPCLETFRRQDADWQHQVLPPTQRRRVVIECGSTFGWHAVATDDGLVLGVDQFGLSAPGQDVLAYYGFTVEAICRRVELHGAARPVTCTEASSLS